MEIPLLQQGFTGTGDLTAALLLAWTEELPHDYVAAVEKTLASVQVWLATCVCLLASLLRRWCDALPVVTDARALAFGGPGCLPPHGEGRGCRAAACAEQARAGKPRGGFIAATRKSVGPPVPWMQRVTSTPTRARRAAGRVLVACQSRRLVPVSWCCTKPSSGSNSIEVGAVLALHLVKLGMPSCSATLALLHGPAPLLPVTTGTSVARSITIPARVAVLANHWGPPRCLWNCRRPRSAAKGVRGSKACTRDRVGAALRR